MWIILFALDFVFGATFSQEAWKQALPVYQAILKHPFNQELAQGRLDQKKFNYYLEQDSLYLLEFAKALSLLSSKMEDPIQAKKILEFASASLSERKRNPTSTAAPFNLMYSSFLLKVAAFETKEELAAALLPCFWIYFQVASDLKKEVQRENPYKTWFDQYSSERYQRSVDWMVAFTDQMATQTTAAIRLRMLQAFHTAFRLEWYFWEGSYHQERWKPSMARP